MRGHPLPDVAHVAVEAGGQPLPGADGDLDAPLRDHHLLAVRAPPPEAVGARRGGGRRGLLLLGGPPREPDRRGGPARGQGLHQRVEQDEQA
ncbi:MAG: hypothetical protein ACK559_26775, partial [bacterium]